MPKRQTAFERSRKDVGGSLWFCHFVSVEVIRVVFSSANAIDLSRAGKRSGSQYLSICSMNREDTSHVDRGCDKQVALRRELDAFNLIGSG